MKNICFMGNSMITRINNGLPYCGTRANMNFDTKLETISSLDSSTENIEDAYSP